MAIQALRKVFAFFATLALAIGLLPGAAYADDENKYTITVNNTNDAISIDGKIYTAYKLFDVTRSGDAYAYTVAEGFADFTYTVGTGDQAVTYEATADAQANNSLVTYVASLAEEDDELGAVTNTNAFAAFAKAVLQYAIENKVAAAGSAEAENETAVIDLTSAGYYLVTGDAVATDGAAADDDKSITSACILTTAARTATVNVKADAPTLDKDIKLANGQTSDVVSLNVGDTVNFVLTSKVPNMTGYTKYVFIMTDTMSKGLTFKEDSVQATIGGEPFTFGEDKVSATTDQEDGTTTLTIDFGDLIGKTPGQAIVVEYSATLNKDALKTDVTTNSAKLTYSNNPNDDSETATGTTPDDKVKIYDFDIVVDKYVKDHTDQKLSGAKFVLKNTDGEYYKVDDKGTEGEPGTMAVTWVKDENDATTVTTDGNGAASFTGIAAGVYDLVETKAPAGYNKLVEPIKVTITVTEGEDGAVDVSGATIAEHGQYQAVTGVGNSAGQLLPGTGGIGTTIFYVGGAVLVIGALGALTFRNRKNTARQ